MPSATYAALEVIPTSPVGVASNPYWEDITMPSSCAAPTSGPSASNHLTTSCSRLLDASGREVRITGISWFGLETTTFAPHGLDRRRWCDLLDDIERLGFNAIRLPFTNQLFDPDSAPSGIDFGLNPDLQGLSGLEIMDKVIAGARERGLRVILDRHRPDAQAQSELWYTETYPEERWITDWKMLGERYRDNDTVIGFDLHNEPHGRACWGCGDIETDWRLAAERADNAILSVNPGLLIIVEGVEVYEGKIYWWGSNLKGVRDYPVRLDLPGQLVYGTHDYGPGVCDQPWFSAPDYPQRLVRLWDEHWGYLNRLEIAPVLGGGLDGQPVRGSVGACCWQAGDLQGGWSPHERGPDVSEAQQAEYYRLLQATAARFVYFEAFDHPWKDWAPVEPYWGLLGSDRSPREVVKVVCGEHP